VAVEEPLEDLRHPVSEACSLAGLRAGAANVSDRFRRSSRTADFILIGVGDEGPPLRLLENEVKASSGLVDPIQANLLERRSISGSKCA